MTLSSFRIEGACQGVTCTKDCNYDHGHLSCMPGNMAWMPELYAVLNNSIVIIN